jgi:ribosomal protein L34
MKTFIRRSSTKARKMTGFRHRMATRAGRQIINRQRRRAMGLGKYNRKQR